MISGIRVSPAKVAVVLSLVVLAVSVASLTGQYLKPGLAHNELALKVIAKLNLDKEVNDLPTWYQSSTLLVSSVLLLVIGLARRELKDKDAKYWGLLSLIFLFLSLDEAVSIHEQMTMPLRTTFHLEGFLFLSWVIPASFLVAVLGIVLSRFLFRLPSSTRNLMILSALIYLAGALGVEMVGANYMFMMNNPPDIGSNFTYAIITTVEEFLEMTGIVVFIYCLLTYLFVPIPAEVEERSVVRTENSEVSAWSIS